jgi:hypothetical protein
MKTKGLRENIEAIFTQIVHLMSELAEGLSNEDHNHSKRKRRC